jgi:DNA-directed RNA polymerase subunit RPC12/RpoP
VDQPVVIAAFRSSAEAEGARAALSIEGIAADVVPRTEELERLCADAFRDGVDVVVARIDAERAIVIVQSIWRDENPGRGRPVEQCPECGSTAIRHLPRLRILLIGVPLLLAAGALTGQRDLFLLMTAIVCVFVLLTPSTRCAACGHRWQRERLPAEETIEQEAPDVACPRCGSTDTERIDRRRERALTLIVNLTIPPWFLFWPVRARRRCLACGHAWR